MRILITGASGLLGINLALEAADGHTVIGQVNAHLLKTERFTIFQTDLLAPHAVERMLDFAQPDWVIHCAAMANLDACEADPARAHQLNTELPRQLAHHVARGGARLLHVSTDAVFDGAHGNYREEDTPNPLSVYAKTKLAGEQAVLEANPNAIVARINIFGWSLSGKRSLAEFFLYNLKEGKAVNGFTDVYFCPLLANDLAHIFLNMLERNLRGVYHVVSADYLSKYEFGLAIAKRFGFDSCLISPLSVQNAGLLASRPQKLTLRSEKLSLALGISLPTVAQGLEKFYHLYQIGYPAKLKALIQNSK